MRKKGKSWSCLAVVAVALLFFTGCSKQQLENQCKNAYTEIASNAKGAGHTTTTEYIWDGTEQREQIEQEIWYRDESNWVYRIQQGGENHWYLYTNEDALERHPDTMWRTSEQIKAPEKHSIPMDWSSQSVQFVSSQKEADLEAISWQQKTDIGGTVYEPIWTFFFTPQKELVQLRTVVQFNSAKNETLYWVNEIVYHSFDPVAMDRAIEGMYQTALENREVPVQNTLEDWLKQTEGYQPQQISFDGRVASAVAADEEIRPFTLRLFLPKGWTWKPADSAQKNQKFPAEGTALEDADHPYFVTCSEWMEPIALYDEAERYVGVLAYAPLEPGQNLIPPQVDLPEGQQAFVAGPNGTEENCYQELSDCANGVQVAVTEGYYQRTNPDNQAEQRKTKAIVARNTDRKLTIAIELMDTAVTEEQLKVIGKSLFY